ncbi:hypothetical protein QAD02_010165 [Eretmocerus hayati]|uniref:Uncharacterized protein n=1 Tax=Eretmocerus hayati TaxID=131215 RepID=A0ACC2NDY8_9HYME|nr:hypothetical protein QAD02_010165 [Eretmocerus hayati]
MAYTAASQSERRLLGQSNMWSSLQQKSRPKRMVLLAQCPDNTTAEKCLADMKETTNGCYHLEINRTPGQPTDKPSIVIYSCGKLYCGQGKRYAPGDPNKPHPLCCQFCEDV